MPDWFAGVADDLAAEAVRGVRVDVVPLVPGPDPSYARTWTAQFDAHYPEVLSRQIDRHVLAAYQHGTREWVDREIRRRRGEQERRDRNAAMVLWGIHL